MINLKKDTIITLIILVISTFIFTGCFFDQTILDDNIGDSDVNITEIALENNDEEKVEYSLFVEGFKEYKGRFTANPNNANVDDFVLVFDNENIIEKSSIEKGIIKDDFVYKIKGKYNGKVTMYIASKDGKCKSKSKTFYFVGGANDPSQIVKIGETATDYYYNVDFKVTRLINNKSFSNGYISINTENNFLLVEIEILNNGKEPFYVNPNNFIVKKYVNKELVSSFEYDSNTFRFEDAMSSCDLNYGIKKRFVILYETDSSTETGDYRILCKGVSNKSGVVIRLQQ